MSEFVIFYCKKCSTFDQSKIQHDTGLLTKFLLRVIFEYIWSWVNLQELFRLGPSQHIISEYFLTSVETHSAWVRKPFL